MIAPMDTREGLEPCPFCGGEAERFDDHDTGSINEGGSCIQCRSCGASSPMHFDRKENLVSSWNERFRASPELTAGGVAPAPWQPDARTVEHCAKIAEVAMENAISRGRALDERSRDHAKEVAREYTARGIAGNIRRLSPVSSPQGQRIKCSHCGGQGDVGPARTFEGDWIDQPCPKCVGAGTVSSPHGKPQS